MKKILILCRQDDRTQYDTRVTMLQGLTKVQSDNTYSGADYENLLFYYDGKTLQVTDTVSGNNLADYDAIFLIGWFKSKILDDIAHAIAHYAKAHGVAFSNSEAYYERSFTKLSQYVVAAINGITVTPFIFSLNQEVLLREAASGKIPLPFIAKAVAASRGHDNHLIREQEQLTAVVREESETPKNFIIQSFVPNNGDYRVLVLGGEVRVVIHRKAQEGSHLNNTSQGGAASLVDIASLPAKLLSDCLKAAELFRREVTGVDMIMHADSGEYFFLEANNMPQLSTGSFVPEKLSALNEYLTKLAG